MDRVIVFGATSAIAGEVAALYAERGDALHLVGRNPDKLAALANRLEAARPQTTVADLAEELGVSRRTLLRDLGALRERGMAITGETGPGGGVRLEGDRGVTAVHLSIAEVVAMWLAARLSQEASDLPWGEAASSGLAKLLGSLPAATGDGPLPR